MTQSEAVRNCKPIRFRYAIFLLFCVASVAQPTQADDEALFRELTVEQRRLWQLMLKEEQRISARQINLFHRHVLDLIVYNTLRDLDITLEYHGIVARDDGRRSSRVVGSHGSPLEWSLVSDLVITTFWLSSVRTNESVCNVTIEEQQFHVNVTFVDDSRSIDTKLRALGDRSVKDVLGELQKTPAKLTGG